jgi:hypothetical protein
MRLVIHKDYEIMSKWTTDRVIADRDIPGVDQAVQRWENIIQECGYVQYG